MNYIMISATYCLCWKKNKSMVMSLLGDILDKLHVADERRSIKNKRTITRTRVSPKADVNAACGLHEQGYKKQAKDANSCWACE